MRWVKPSSATVSPSRTAAATASASGTSLELDSDDPRVVLGQHPRRRRRRCHVPELRELQLAIELVAIRLKVEHRGHPPGEVLAAPDPPEAALRVAVEDGAVSGPIPLDERLGEDIHVPQ